MAREIDSKNMIFLAAGVSIVMIALITIAVQTLGAARSNPVKTLRRE